MVPAQVLNLLKDTADELREMSQAIKLIALNGATGTDVGYSQEVLDARTKLASRIARRELR